VLTCTSFGGLPVSRRHIIADRIPKDIVKSILRLGKILHITTYDDGQLDFVVEFLGGCIDRNILVWPGKSIYSSQH
jgi:hypothetical protein